MIRKKVLSIGNNSATLLVQDTESNGALLVLRRVSVADWRETEVQAVVSMYENIQRARIAGMVPIHNVIVQNSFLSVVAAYMPGGDVTNYIEEGTQRPLEEKRVLQWMSAIAQTLKSIHAKKACFYGLSTDRLFMDKQSGGTAQVLLGVPVPSRAYFSQLREKKQNGVAVELDYPPEVLKSETYHPTLSDVWCLGRLGSVLLSANGGSLQSRSSDTRQLIARLMATETLKRPSLDEAIRTLTSLVGNVRLGQPAWPPARSGAGGTTPPPVLQSGNRNVASAPPEEKSSNASSTVSGPPNSGNRSGPPDSWHRRAEEQFAQLQQLNASPPRRRGSPPAAARPTPTRIPVAAVKRPATASPNRPKRNSTGLLDNNTRVLNEMFAERDRAREEPTFQNFTFGSDGEHHAVGHDDGERYSKADTAQRHHEMRKHFTQWQKDTNKRLANSGNVVVSDSDGVLIVAPRSVNTPTPPAAPPSPPAVDVHEKPSGASFEIPNSISAAAPAKRTAPAVPPPQVDRVQHASPPQMPRQQAPPPPASPPKQRQGGAQTSPPVVPTVPTSRGTTPPLSPREHGVVSPTPELSRPRGGPAMRPTAPPSSSQQPRASPSVDRNPSRKSSNDVATLSTLEWTIDGVRSSLRTLLRDKDLYGETVQEVALFVSQSEEARMSARCNEVFMRRLRELIRDERLLNGAAPLCAQLAALEGLQVAIRALQDRR